MRVIFVAMLAVLVALAPAACAPSGGGSPNPSAAPSY